jgi:hypothetical protein
MQPTWNIRIRRLQEAQLACPHCPRFFHTRRTLKYHLRVKHAAREPLEPTPEETFPLLPDDSSGAEDGHHLEYNPWNSSG